MTKSILNVRSDEFKVNQRKLAKYQSEHRNAPTEAERMVKEALEEAGIRFTFQKGLLRDKTLRIVDFLLPRPWRIFLEVDGGYHDAQRDYDKYREGRIKNQRDAEWKFIRVTNEWVKQQDDLAEALRCLLNSARGDK